MDTDTTHPIVLASALADELEVAVKELREGAYGRAEGAVDAALALAIRLRNLEVGRWLDEQRVHERPRRSPPSRRARGA